MEAAILVVIMIAGFTYSAIKTKESWKNRCKRTLKEKYGKEPEKKEFKRELIRNYLDTVGGTQQVDEVTWNDLNMDDVYQRINNCDSTMGEEILYAKLHYETLSNNQLPEGVLSLIEDTSRETATAFMKMNEYVDVLIPRGGSGLIRAVVANATIPVIETGTGNCHIYVDETADLDMAVNIINNAKTQRIGVCNACESLVLHESIVDELMPRLSAKLSESHVEIRGDERVQKATKDAVAATEKDWGTEYLDYIISAKTVSDIDEAITHINKYNTGHSEAIITNNYEHAQKFLNEIDAAAVYVNASTRFTDGFEFGFGAEIGISTQKLHARGPMGLEALTTTKYIIYGDGQIRE